MPPATVARRRANLGEHFAFLRFRRPFARSFGRIAFPRRRPPALGRARRRTLRRRAHNYAPHGAARLQLLFDRERQVGPLHRRLPLVRAVAPLPNRRPRVSADRRKNGARSRPPHRSRGDSALLVRNERKKAFAARSARPRSTRARRAPRNERRSLRFRGTSQGRGTPPSARRRRRSLPLQPRSVSRLLPQGLLVAHDEGQDRHASRRPSSGARPLLGRDRRDGRNARRPHRSGAYAAGA